MKLSKLVGLTVISSLLVATISGCAGPYSGEKAQVGAVTGAAAGAAIGALTSSSKDRGKGAVIGATAGAVLGGTGGYVLDKRDRENERNRYYDDRYNRYERY